MGFSEIRTLCLVPCGTIAAPCREWWHGVVPLDFAAAIIQNKITMRPKVVLAILLMAAGVLAVAVMLSKVFRPQPAVAPAQVAITHSNSSPVTPGPEPAVEIAPAPITITNRDTNAITRQDREEYLRNRYDELMDLARQNSPAATQQIVDELKNPDKAIRRAALDALEQANDRSVVPKCNRLPIKRTILMTSRPSRMP